MGLENKLRADCDTVTGVDWAPGLLVTAQVLGLR